MHLGLYIGSFFAQKQAGASVCWAVTNCGALAGQDRAFRVFSVIQDQQSREVSQGHIAHRAKRMRLAQEDLKLPRVISMDACQVNHCFLAVPALVSL